MGKVRRRLIKPRNAAAKALPKFKHVRHKDRTKYNRKRDKAHD